MNAQKGYAPAIVVLVIAIIFAMAGGVLYVSRFHYLPTLTTKAPIASPTANSNSLAPEMHNFPIYPNATYIKKEIKDKCTGKESGFTQCGSTVYTWETADGFTPVEKYFKMGENNWSCSGGAGTITDDTHANTTTSCTDGTFGANLDLVSEPNKTTIQAVFMNRNDESKSINQIKNWKTFVKKNDKYSIQYPDDYFVMNSDLNTAKDNSDDSMYVIILKGNEATTNLIKQEKQDVTKFYKEALTIYNGGGKCDENYFTDKTLKKSVITVGGVQGVKWEGEVLRHAEPFAGDVVIFVENSASCYRLFYLNGPNVKKSEDLLKQMLSTFQFTE